jgi:signal peptidase II
MVDAKLSNSGAARVLTARRWPWLLAAVIVLLDRLTKLAIIAQIPYGSHGIPVVPGLALTHVRNRGIAFGLLNDGGMVTRWVLPVVVIVSVVIIAWLAMRHSSGSRTVATAFGLILGGAVGNLWDRIQYGWVVDFLHVWVRVGDSHWSWPDFNVADSAITIGAVTLIVSELLGNRPEQDEPTAETEPED